MTDVDAILASGWYTDRRGREWHLCDKSSSCTPCDMWHEAHPSVGISGDRMRALIERDQHRDVCPELRECEDHPVPHVVTYLDGLGVCVAYTSGEGGGGIERPTLPAAMDAAIELAKGEA